MRHTNNDLSPEYVKSILGYDPVTGVLTWKHRSGNDHGTNIFNAKFSGKEAGTVGTRGYISVQIVNPETGKRHHYLAHRLAHVIMTGEWPDGIVDHDDGDTGNNRWANLKDRTQGENVLKGERCNSVPQSGRRGVYWHKKAQKWMAQAKDPHTGKPRYLGLFADKVAASNAHDAFVQAGG